MKLRLLIVGGAVAALSTLSLAANAAPGTGTGTCASSSNPTPPAGSQTVGLPDGGQVYAGGDQASASGAAGIEGPHGYLQAGGAATSGGAIEGYSTDPGNLNGTVTISSSPGVCIGVAGETVHS